MISPPMLSVSFPTMPEAVDPSPYEIFQVASLFLKVLDLEASKMLCSLLPVSIVLLGSCVDHSYQRVS